MSNKRLDKITAKAKEVVANNEKVQGLLSDVKRKIDKIRHDSEERTSFIYKLQVIIRMLRAHFRGQYNAFSTSTILTLVFALVYFVVPLDLIPDFIPGLGLTDDISIVYMIFKSVGDDISRFKLWESDMQNI